MQASAVLARPTSGVLRGVKTFSRSGTARRRSKAMPEILKLNEAVEFAENPAPRCPCVLLLDTSGSMQGSPIDALNQGLLTFKDDLIKDPLASRRVEVAVVTFDSAVKVIQDFVTADKF
jgi:hypothetical protein